MRSIVIAGALFVAVLSTASAEELTLRAVSAFAEKTTYSRGWSASSSRSIGTARAFFRSITSADRRPSRRSRSETR